MDISTDDRRSQIMTDTLDVSSSLPRTDALDVSDINAPRRTDAAMLYTQFYTFVKELTQVLEGDLRVQLTTPEGNMGVLAEVCNALIEKLVQFSRWTLYSAEQTISTSRVLLDHAVAQAQVAENQILQIASVISTLEGTVTSTQRLSSTLYRSAASGREQETCLIQKKLLLEEGLSQVSQEQVSSLAEQIVNKEEIEQKQFYTLEEASRSLSENADTTEASISDLYTVVQSLHASTIGVLQMTEHIGEQIKIAEDWKHSIEGLRLPEEEQKEAETGWLL